jgi:hypothetical protein
MPVFQSKPGDNNGHEWESEENERVSRQSRPVECTEPFTEGFIRKDACVPIQNLSSGSYGIIFPR